jgi:hypothetical protein
MRKVSRIFRVILVEVVERYAGELVDAEAAEQPGSFSNTPITS